MSLQGNYDFAGGQFEWSDAQQRNLNLLLRNM
jgi:hypothetical protein